MDKFVLKRKKQQCKIEEEMALPNQFMQRTKKSISNECASSNELVDVGKKKQYKIEEELVPPDQLV